MVTRYCAAGQAFGGGVPAIETSQPARGGLRSPRSGSCLLCSRERLRVRRTLPSNSNLRSVVSQMKRSLGAVLAVDGFAEPNCGGALRNF